MESARYTALAIALHSKLYFAGQSVCRIQFYTSKKPHFYNY